jgi:hypothetical protein
MTNNRLGGKEIGPIPVAAAWIFHTREGIRPCQLFRQLLQLLCRVAMTT